MRGENSSRAVTRRLAFGTPPHAWGKRHAAQSPEPLNRYTPTCVGKTLPDVTACEAFKVHPHMRGENVDEHQHRRAADGTPPHAWGKLYSDSNSSALIRYTPTCVGKTAGARCRAARITVHPHMRGENGKWYEKTSTDEVHPHMRGENAQTRSYFGRQDGTPPHAWGKHCGKQITRISHRYTPTCVGKTPFIVETASSYAVHPHMRGENGANGQARAVLVGTPPHAWGKLPTLLNFLTCSRYTPTCVGKTSRSTTVFRHSAVHPHMRGENATSTPAMNCLPVHPHMRGENVSSDFFSFTAGGTPPHAWGKRWRQPGCGAKRRYTPTCVGKT